MSLELLARKTATPSHQRPAKRKKRKHTEAELVARRAKQDAKREASTNYTNDHQVLTLRQWAALNNISIASAKKLLWDGEGPQTIQLTKRRIGIRMIDNRRWQESRAR